MGVMADGSALCHFSFYCTLISAPDEQSVLPIARRVDGFRL